MLIVYYCNRIDFFYFQFYSVREGYLSCLLGIHWKCHLLYIINVFIVILFEFKRSFKAWLMIVLYTENVWFIRRLEELCMVDH